MSEMRSGGPALPPTASAILVSRNVSETYSEIKLTGLVLSQLTKIRVSLDWANCLMSQASTEYWPSLML